MSKRIGYICPRCDAVHSVEDYQKSLFCRQCGSFLKKRRFVVKRPSKQASARCRSNGERFFPYSSFRPFQKDAVNFAFNIIKNRRIGLLSSPCGTGKSISVLTAFFMAKELDDSVGRLLALTRTRSQLEIYCRELKKIKECSDVNFVASIFQSKKEMCPHVQKNSTLRNIGYRDFLHYCRNLKDGAFGRKCEYYERTYRGRRLSGQAFNAINGIKEVGPLLPHEVYKIGVSARLCPHEITNILCKYADIIVGNYNYVLVDSVRNSVLGRAGIKVEEVNCIFDEAHSLPHYAVGILSDELSSISVERAEREAETFDVDDFGFLDVLHEVMVKSGREVYKEYGLDVEHVIEPNEIAKALLERLRVDPERLKEIVSELEELGEAIRCKRVEGGRNPISYLSRCATFFADWISLVGSSYAGYVKAEAGNSGSLVKLGIRCLDPALAAGVIGELRSAVLMSGTLWHTDYYIDVLGIDRNRCKSVELPSPFPRENRLIAVDTSVTTKFERRNKAQWKKIADHLEKIVAEIDGRVAVYFPSYAIMQEVVEASSFDLSFLLEERDTKIIDVVRFLKAHEQCVFLGVARGKVSEGVDMSLDGRSLLSAVITIGLPYPRRTELQSALVKHFREKFGEKAIEYAIVIPCLNALAQSAGRLLRSPKDKGIIVMMDRRAAGRFKQKLPEDWREDMQAHYNIERILERIKSFAVANISLQKRK